jgi:hypothetical protein
LDGGLMSMNKLKKDYWMTTNDGLSGSLMKKAVSLYLGAK